MTSRGTRGTLLAACLLLSACSSEPRPPNVVLIVIDTLRADALGSYGAGDAASPVLDALASKGVVFERVIAPATWTKPSMASIFTARPAADHGVRLEEDALPAKLTTLAEVFAAAGYRTLGVNSNPWLTGRFAFDAGFERYESTLGIAARVNSVALDWLEEASERPTFLFLHYMDVHAPYRPSPEFFAAPSLRIAGQGRLSDAVVEERYRKRLLDGPGIRARVRALYAAGVRQLDADIGELLDSLDRRGFLEDAIIAVTSDHGEAFGEHGRPVHGQDVYPELHRVPWIVRAAGRVPEGVRISGVVSGIDVAPTLLRLAGIAPPAEFEGVAQLLPAGAPAGAIPALTVGGLSQQEPDRDFLGVVWREHLLVRERRSGVTEFYDLTTDPGAHTDLTKDRTGDLTGERRASATYRELAALAERAQGIAVKPPPHTEIDPDTRRQLESLGYLDPAASR